MASTYSTSLRLELMATGDQSGTWGTTTNTNLGTLLEQAITGYLSVAQGDVANLTLTTVNGGSDQARNIVIKITGALTTTRNVVVQTANKPYTIINATTGGFSITVKTSGGTGVSVPPGATVDLFSDGTNVVMGQNYWSGQVGGAVWLDAGATFGPEFELFRDSASPAVSDINGRLTFSAPSSTGVKRRMAYIEQSTIDPTNASEDASLGFYAQVAGTPTLMASLGPNLMLPTGRVIDWAAGDVTIAHSANTLAFAGATTYTFDASVTGTVTLGTPQTASTTAVDFTSIPNWVRKISVNISGLSGSGTSNFLIQIGDSGGIENSGYVGGYVFAAAGPSTGATTSTAGFLAANAAAASTHRGSIVLRLLDASTFTWVCAGITTTDGSVQIMTSGDKSLTATLDRVRVTFVNGTDTFDAGKINIAYS